MKFDLLVSKTANLQRPQAKSYVQGLVPFFYWISRFPGPFRIQLLKFSSFSGGLGTPVWSERSPKVLRIYDALHIPLNSDHNFCLEKTAIVFRSGLVIFMVHPSLVS